MKSCPYCSAKIKREEALYFYNNNDDFFSFVGSAADSMLTNINNAVFQKHGGDGSRYFEYWHEKFKIDPDEIKNSTAGVVLHRDEVDIAVNQMDEYERNRYNIRTLGPNKVQIGVYEIDFAYLDPMGTNAAARAVPRIGRTGIDNRTPYALVCPRCENLLPLDYFDNDCINIILTGSSSVGKTVFVMSMLQSNFVNLTGNTGRLRITRGMENCDVCTKQFFEDLRRFNSSGDLPLGTKRPLPPLFLSFEWSLRDQTTYKHTLCLIDTEGERWDRERSKDSIAPMIDQCDGMLYLVEPSQGDLARRSAPVKVSGGAPSRGSHKNVRMARLPSQTNRTDDRNDAKQGTANYIYGKYFDVESGIYQQMNCAFVLSKLDRYLEGGKYQGAIDTAKIPFWHNLTSYDDESRSDSRTQLFDSERAVYHCIAAYELLRTYFKMPLAQNCSFGNCQWFAVSSFSGEAKYREQGGRPYVEPQQQAKTLNLHEPLMWLLSEIVPKKLAQRRAAEEAKARAQANIVENVEFEQ